MAGIESQRLIALSGAFANAGDTVTANSAGIPITVPLGSTIPNNFEVVAGAGTNQATAAALSSTKFIHQITGANGTVGWILPATPVANVVHELIGTTAGVALVYPATGGTINGGSANAALSLTTGVLYHKFISTGADTWIGA